LLLGERLDDVDTDDVLLGDRRDVGHLLLDVPQDRMRNVAVAVRERDDERRHRERDQRQAPLEVQHHRRHAHDRQHVLEEEDQAVAEEEADRLEVDGGTRHQLARLVAVVEAEGHPHEVGVEGVPHVELDAERLPAGDEPAAHHQQRLRDSEADDDPDQGPELVAPLGNDRAVDHAARHPDEADRGRLGGDGEHDRDQQRPAVRPQEPDQAGERHPIGRCLLHFLQERRV
jgi:hypothetical protein